jgi:hypothetical protein
MVAVRPIALIIRRGYDKGDLAVKSASVTKRLPNCYVATGPATDPGGC